MTTGLDGITILSGSDFTVDRITFARDTGDTIDYTNAVVSVEFYDAPTATVPLLTLTSSGSAFTNITNTAASQVFSLTLSTANLTTLLASKTSNKVGYRFLLTPAAGRVANPPKGRGYTGQLTVQIPSYVAK